jgi:hypothetical protein
LAESAARKAENHKRDDEAEAAAWHDERGERRKKEKRQQGKFDSPLVFYVKYSERFGKLSQ